MTSTDASARAAPLTAKRESSPVDVKAPSPRSPKDQSRQFIKPLLKSHRELNRPPFDCIALVLQGGGALGAFQAGVYQGLAEANLHPDWVAGISIGAINAALIAGNAPEARLEKLRAFWEQVTTQLLFDPFGIAHYWLRGDTGHVFLNRFRAGATLLEGAPGFFQAANSAALLRGAGYGRGHQLVRHRAVAQHAGAPRRLRSHQRRRDALQRRRCQHPQRQLRLFRFDQPQDRARAHHGERRTAARLSGRRGGRRTLLGWRARLQHPAAMGGGGRYPPGYAHVPSRPVERPRRLAERSQRCQREAERDPIFEQDAGQYGSFQADPVHACGIGRRAAKDSTRDPRLRGRQAAAVRRGSQRLPDRAPHLPLEEL